MEIEQVVPLMAGVYTITLGWLFMMVRANASRVYEMQKNSYTKAETEKMIALHNKPIIQSMETIKEDITEIKQLLGKLFDAQNNKK